MKLKKTSDSHYDKSVNRDRCGWYAERETYYRGEFNAKEKAEEEGCEEVE